MSEECRWLTVREENQQYSQDEDWESLPWSTGMSLYVWILSVCFILIQLLWIPTAKKGPCVYNNVNKWENIIITILSPLFIYDWKNCDADTAKSWNGRMVEHENMWPLYVCSYKEMDTLEILQLMIIVIIV